MKWFEELAERVVGDEYFKEIFVKLEEIYSYRFLKIETNLALSEKEFLDILRFADILSRSELAPKRNLAFKVVSLLYDNFRENDTYKGFSNSILTKLGNFASLNIAVKNDSDYDNYEIALEKAVKKTFQQSPFDGLIFTDPQFKLYESLKESNHYSFSGPTSFGKSFIMEAFINYIISERHGIDNIVVLVPTRALITQVANKLKQQVGNKNYKILSFPIVPTLFKQKQNKFIFVFTPERLVSFLSNKESPAIDYMFVDEAQKIIAKKDSRAPLYYHAILLAERKSIKLFFASPNIPNAEIFLQLFEKSIDETMVIEESPVAQNRFFLDFIDERTLFFSENGNEYELPNIAVRKKYAQSDMLKKLGGDCKNIVYCNTIEDTIHFALNFASSLIEKQDERIDEAIELVQNFVHKDYFLIDCLRKGVAFHFGRLPQRIREKIELLFQAQAIDFIFCTSTLLEGINLPAKNIFIYNNAIGNSKFSDIDFWNLAGRAGRLTKELSGNIICIRAFDKKNRWDDPPKDLDVVRNKKIEKVVPLIVSGEKNFYKNIECSLLNKDFTRKNASQEQMDIWNHYANIAFIHQTTKSDSILISNFLKMNSNAKKLLNSVYTSLC